MRRRAELLNLPVSLPAACAYGLLAAVAFLFLPAACQAPTPPGNQTSAAPPAVATVNGRPITVKLYEMYLKNGQEELGINPATDEGKRKLELLREGIVSELIDRNLIAQEAERRGLSLPPEELKEAERQAVERFGGERQYDDYLARHHLTRDEYREVIRWEVYGGKMREEFSKQISVGDGELKKYYDERKADAALQLPERVTASHILIAARAEQIRQQLGREKGLTGEALEKELRAEMARRRARAEELRRKLAAGADFAALARESSEDPSSREQGGALGTFIRNSHPKAFDDAAFALKVGALSPIVETDYGFHIIKVTAHEETRAQTLEEAKPQMTRRLVAERLATNLKQWLAEARRSADIRVNEAFRFGALKNEFPAM
jgi:parvulin-like peptidyl-prolyl isomerase